MLAEENALFYAATDERTPTGSKPVLKTKEQRAFEAIVSEAASKQGEAAFYTVEAPGEFSAAKHVPTINIEGRKATIVVPHGQAEDHFIEFVWAKDQSGTVLAAIKLTPADAPQLSFDVPEAVTTITAFEYCNKHGAWASAATSL